METTRAARYLPEATCDCPGSRPRSHGRDLLQHWGRPVAWRLFCYLSAGNAGAASAQCFGGVGIVVAAGMNDQGMPPEIFEVNPGRQHGKGGFAGFIYIQGRQVTQVPLTVRALVRAGALRVEMAARGLEVGGVS